MTPINKVAGTHLYEDLKHPAAVPPVKSQLLQGGCDHVETSCGENIMVFWVLPGLHFLEVTNTEALLQQKEDWDKN